MDTYNKQRRFNGRLAFCLSLCLFILPNYLLGQGVLVDSTDSTTPQLPFFDGAKGNTIYRASKSLRQYCPTPADQGYFNYCVAYACSYGAFTIKKQLPKEKIDKEAFSAACIFNKIDMRGGAKIDFILNVMKDTGVYKIQDFPNSLAIKSPLSPNAKRYKTKAVPLIDSNQLKDIFLENIFKPYLANGSPIIVAAWVDHKFRQRYKNTSEKEWLPIRGNGDFRHAMVIVGYDNDAKTFDIMNSYGTIWGDGGFIKVKYVDLAKVLISAHILGGLSTGKGVDDEGNPLPYIDSTQDESVATIRLNQYSPNTKTFTPKSVHFNEQKQVYETNLRNYVKDVFQIIASDIPKDKHLYAFSLDPVGKVTVHWPPDARWQETDTNTANHYAPDFGQTPVSSLIPLDNLEVKIPDPNGGLCVKNQGNDDILMLIADDSIPNFRERLDAFKTEKGTAKTRLATVFADVLIPFDRITYASDEIKARHLVYETKGSVVPIVLSLNVE